MLVASGINRTEPRAKVARHSVRQRKRIETNIEFAAAFHPAWPFHFSHRTGNITAGRAHDVARDHDREHGFEVDTIAGDRMLCADTIDQSKGNPRAGLDSVDRGRFARADVVWRVCGLGKASMLQINSTMAAPARIGTSGASKSFAFHLLYLHCRARIRL